MNEMKPSVRSGSKLSAVWILPLVAVVIGLWMVIHTAMTEGPSITIDFASAEGLVAGKTKVRILSHEIGLVEEVVLKADVSGVTATVKLEPEAKSLLREDTQFWVVRARVGAGGVSGLGTLLSGAYIEMAPGSAAEGREAFLGLEAPPLTPVGAPGLRLTLFSDRAGSVSVGNAVLFQGYEVGRVEAAAFNADREQVRYDIFIDAPFHQLIHSATRFWDVSGVDVNASASGIEVNTGSMETILLGGLSFGTPPGVAVGQPVADGAAFTLYDSYNDILGNPYKHGTYYVVSFQQSLRGLVSGAPVEYRGIQIGRVERLLLKEVSAIGLGDDRTNVAIPVLIYLEPGRLQIPDSEDSVSILRENIEQSVYDGMRATLQTGNLLTGRKLVSFDFYPEEAPAELGQFEQYTTLPTIGTGLVQLETQVSDFLKKLNALPVEETVGGANKALASLATALASADATLSRADTAELPGEMVLTLQKMRVVLDGFSNDAELYKSLNASLRSLDATLNNTTHLTRKLSDKPNALLLPTRTAPDLIPRAKDQ